MTVLVTGGSGLVGSHVIAALVARGTPVRALARPAACAAVNRLGAVAITGSVTDDAAWRAALATPGGVQAIVHAAALVGQRVPWSDFVAVNVGGTRRAVTAARTAGARLVHVSSVAIYGRRAIAARGAERRDESDPFQPLAPSDFYARSKRLAEEVVWGEVARGGVWAAAVRPNVIYGEYDRLFTPRVVRVVRRGWAPQVGPGTNALSCVYAGNVAAAIVAALDADVPAGRAFNVTNDGELTQRMLTDVAAATLGVRVRRLRVPRAAAVAALAAFGAARRLLHPGRYPGVAATAVAFLAGENPYQSNRARTELGWAPSTPPAVGLAQAVRWVMENETPGR